MIGGRLSIEAGYDRGATLVVFQAGSRVCALRRAHVVEIMRPLPVESLAGMPPFVRGVAVVRGVPLPVIDARRLLGVEGEGEPRRFLTLLAGGRTAALAVDAVLGVFAAEAGWLDELPSILGGSPDDLVEAIGARDAELLVVLRGARVVPDDVWRALDAGGAPP